MLARDIMLYLDQKIAPLTLAYPDDLVGLVFGDPDRDVKRIGVAWAATDFALEQAGVLSAAKFAKVRRIPRPKLKFDKKKEDDEEKGVDMLVLHEYPFYEEICDRFPGLSFFEKPANYKRLKDLIGKEVCVYVAHSNLDETEGGTVDILSKTIGIKVTGKVQCGRWGKIPETLLSNIISNLKSSYGLEVLRVAGDPETTRKYDTAGCYIGNGFSSTDVVEEFYLKGAKVIVSSGLTEEVAHYANELGLVLLDIERSKLERPVMMNLAEKMQGDLKNTTVNLYETEEAIVYV